MGTLVILDLMGGVALLLWGLHMVRTGILRAFGPDLRHLLSKTIGNRFTAFFAGLALTAVLQSSTATGLMAASFASDGLVALVPAWRSCSVPMLARRLSCSYSRSTSQRPHQCCSSSASLPSAPAPAPRIKDLGRVAIGLG